MTIEEQIFLEDVGRQAERIIEKCKSQDVPFIHLKKVAKVTAKLMSDNAPKTDESILFWSMVHEYLEHDDFYLEEVSFENTKDVWITLFFDGGRPIKITLGKVTPESNRSKSEVSFSWNEMERLMDTITLYKRMYDMSYAKVYPLRVDGVQVLTGPNFNTAIGCNPETHLH